MDRIKLRKNLLLLKRGKFKRFFEVVLGTISLKQLSFIFFYCRFFVLSYLIPKNNIKHGLKSICTRFAQVGELDKLNKLKADEEYPSRFDKGDICVVAETEGQIIGMEWIQHNKDREGGVDYVISLPKDSVWLHDGYVEPSYRLRGVWVNLMFEIINYCQKKLIKNAYTLIYSGNEISINTHKRYGFKIEKEVTYLRILGINIHSERIFAATPPKTRFAISYSLRKR